MVQAVKTDSGYRMYRGLSDVSRVASTSRFPRGFSWKAVGLLHNFEHNQEALTMFRIFSSLFLVPQTPRNVSVCPVLNSGTNCANFIDRLYLGNADCWMKQEMM